MSFPLDLYLGKGRILVCAFRQVCKHCRCQFAQVVTQKESRHSQAINYIPYRHIRRDSYGNNRFLVRPLFRILRNRNHSRRLDICTLLTNNTNLGIVQMRLVSTSVSKDARHEPHRIPNHGQNPCFRPLEINLYQVSFATDICPRNSQGIHKVTHSPEENECRFRVHLLNIGTFAQGDNHHTAIFRDRLYHGALYNGSHLILNGGPQHQFHFFAGILVDIGIMIVQGTRVDLIRKPRKDILP